MIYRAAPVLFGLPLIEYPACPTDLPNAQKIPCPECNELMWMGEKKFRIMLGAEEGVYRICCGTCLKKTLKKEKTKGRRKRAKITIIRLDDDGIIRMEK